MSNDPQYLRSPSELSAITAALEHLAAALGVAKPRQDPPAAHRSDQGPCALAPGTWASVRWNDRNVFLRIDEDEVAVWTAEDDPKLLSLYQPWRSRSGDGEESE